MGDPPWQLRKSDASIPPVSLEDPGGEFSHPSGALHVLPEERLVLNLHAGSCYCWDFQTGKFLKVIKTLYEWDCRRPYLLSFNWPTRFSLLRLPDFQMLLEDIPFAGDFLSNRQCSGIAIAPAGELLAAAQPGGNVQIFDLRQEPPAEVPSLLVQTAQVTAMRFDPSGRWLALGDDNGAMYLYDVLGHRVLPLDWQHRGAVKSLRFSADGLWLASGGDDGVVRIFNTTNGRVMMSKLVHSAAVVHTVFSSRGDQVAVLTEDKSLHLWDLRDSSPDRVLTHSAPVTSVAFDADGRRLASGDQSGVVQIWDVPAGTRTDRIESRRGVAGLQFSGDLLGVTGLTVPGGRGFSLWDLAQSKWLMNDIGTGLGNGAGTHIVRIGPDGRWLAIAFADRLNLVDIDSGQTAAQFLTGHPHFFIQHVAFSPDGRYLAFSPAMCGEPAPKIVVIDVAGGQELHRLRTPDGLEVRRLQFTPDSRQLILTGFFGVRIWHVDDGRQCDVAADLQQARLDYGSFSNDGGLLATVSRSHHLQVWNTEDWKPCGRRISLDGAVVFAGFDPGGQRIATATARGVAQLWDWRTAEPLTPALLHGAPINDAALSPDGRWLAVAGSDRAARIWRLSLEGIATEAPPPRDWRPGWHLLQANEAHRFNYPAGEIFHLEHLLQLRPDDQQSALRLAAVCLQTGQWQRTVDILTPLLRGEAASDELFLARARAQLQLDRTDLALKDLDQAAAFDAELPELPLWRAAIYARQGDFTAATSLCRTAADWTFDRWLSSPSSLPQHVQKQSLAVKEHRWLPLRTFVDERLAEADGDAKRAWLQIRAITHLSSGKLESAQQDWQTIVQQWQDDPLARYALALLAAKRETWEQVLEHAAKVDAGDAPWQFLQATALARLQQPADAMSRINNAISQGATNADTYALRARLHLALNDLDAAEKDAQRAIDDESRADAWYVLAHVNARRRQWDVAADAFAVFERSSAGAIEPWQDLILCCLQAGRIDQAREAAERQLRFVDKIDHWAHHELVNTILSPIAVCPPKAGLEFTPLIVDHLELMASQRGVYSATLALVLLSQGQFERAAEVMKARGEEAELDLREQTVAAMIEDGLGRKNQSHQKAQTIRARLNNAASLPWQQRAEIEILLNQFAPRPTSSSGH